MRLSDPYLQLNVRHTIGSLKLDVRFQAHAGWTVLFGASGSGKSTVLRMIAGMVAPDDGQIVVFGRLLVDICSHVNVVAHDRGVRWAGQTAMLFPRMTVRENLGFGGAERVDEAVEHFGLGRLAEKRPRELSGGEAQRVAVVRAAMGAKGKLLLLDEPFTGLDAGVRDGLIGQLREWLGETPVISVTHDVGEAFLLGAEVVRMSEGRVLAQGAVGEVLGAERERLKGVLGDTRPNTDLHRLDRS